MSVLLKSINLRGKNTLGGVTMHCYFSRVVAFGEKLALLISVVPCLRYVWDTAFRSSSGVPQARHHTFKVIYILFEYLLLY